MKVNELLIEDYWDRVRDTANAVAKIVGPSANKEKVLDAIHTVSVKQDHVTDHNSRVIYNKEYHLIKPNGVSDYNGSRQMKKEFVGDVISALQGKIKIKTSVTSLASGLTNQQIWNKVEQALSMAFPDGEPIDHLQSWMKQNSITMKEINAAVAWANNMPSEEDALSSYIADLWDSAADDAMHDAEHGDAEDNNPFYDKGAMDLRKLHSSPDQLIGKTTMQPKVKKRFNPWR